MYFNFAQHKQKGNTVIFLLIGVLILVVAAGGAYYFGKSQKSQNPTLTSKEESAVAPEEVVKTFYNTWLGCEKEFTKYTLQMGPVPQEASQQREDCIKKLMTDYTVIQTEHPGDSTMWCAQDFPSKVDVDKAIITGNTATALSHHMFEYSGDNQIKVTLTLINNAWKISDTTCLRSNSSSFDETANWSTYKDTKLKFSLKYPSNGNIVILRSLAEGGVELVRKEEKDKDIADIQLKLSVYYRGETGLDPERAFREGECSKPCDEKTEKVNINNAVGITTLGPNYPGKDNYYLTDQNQKGPVLRLFLSNIYDFQGQSALHAEDIAIFRKIIQTFKFER